MLMKHLFMHFHNIISLGQIVKLSTYRSITMLNLFPACMIAFSAWEKVSDVTTFTHQSRLWLHHYRFITNKQKWWWSCFKCSICWVFILIRMTLCSESYLIMGHVEDLLSSNGIEEIIWLETNICSQAVARDLRISQIQ